MNIFERFSRVAKANVNELLNKMEDPEKVMNQAVEDLQKDRNRIDSLARENDQLRNFLAGGGPTGGAGANKNNVLI